MSPELSAPTPPEPSPAGAPRRIVVDGKFFRDGPAKFYVKGVTYGPFAPNERGEPFAGVEETARDFRLLRALGANVLRVYHVPPRWFLDLAPSYGLRVLIDIPWSKHLCFLDSRELCAAARRAVREAAAVGRAHPAVFAYSVVNEIPPDIVRWSGVRRVEGFIEELVEEVRQADPGALCTFTSFPSTEYLEVQNADFACFNVYLHERDALERYLSRLQMLSDTRPLVLGELGMDSIRQGRARQAQFLREQLETVFRGGLAGAVVFSFTDDWHRGGAQITDWAFGLTTAERVPKESFEAVRECFEKAPCFPEARQPRVSVVVASYNGAHTLRPCLHSLTALNYPDLEVILVDDGSTDETAEIAREFPGVRYLPIPHGGLSVARNAGIEAATGQIVAFTDSDCRADEDWLRYIVADLVRSDFAGIGGPNYLPPEDSPVAAAVMASPGGPSHVMLTDREAEHIPGCNMAFYREELRRIGSFDPIFWRAGDDVDLCWRLQQAGRRIGFSPSGFVWHYRRSTVRAYLKQQAGYGEAEALLARKHPEYFNSLGGGVWRGRIYSAGLAGVTMRRPVIYHGVFGSGLFQRLYAAQPATLLAVFSSLEFYVFVALPLLVVSASFLVVLPVALAALGVSVGACVAAGVQARLPRDKQRAWSRPLVALLTLLQPVVRGWARHRWRLRISGVRRFGLLRLAEARRARRSEAREYLQFWSDGSTDRLALLSRIVAELEREGWPCRWDSGWTDHDVEIELPVWCRIRLLTAAETLDAGRLNLRVRLAAQWSTTARVVFWGLLAVEAVLAGLFAPFQPWLWMGLLSLPVVSGWFDLQVRTAQSALAAVVEQAAADLKLKALPAKPPGRASGPG